MAKEREREDETLSLVKGVIKSLLYEDCFEVSKSKSHIYSAVVIRHLEDGK